MADAATTHPLIAKAQEDGQLAIRILRNIRTRTGGWFDCECGDCINYGDDFHAWEAFERNAKDAIHYACLYLAEAAEAALQEAQGRLRALEQEHADAVTEMQRDFAKEIVRACEVERAALEFEIAENPRCALTRPFIERAEAAEAALSAATVAAQQIREHLQPVVKGAYRGDTGKGSEWRQCGWCSGYADGPLGSHPMRHQDHCPVKAIEAVLAMLPPEGQK